MEDFPVLLIFFLFYFILGSSGKKKKPKRGVGRNVGPVYTSAQQAQTDQPTEERNQQTLEEFDTVHTEGTSPESHICEMDRIHLREIPDMQQIGEGEDPCHAGDSAGQDQFDFSLEESRGTLKEDVLRGVVMSEILMRPHERRALQRSRRAYHGQ